MCTIYLNYLSFYNIKIKLYYLQKTSTTKLCVLLFFFHRRILRLSLFCLLFEYYSFSLASIPSYLFSQFHASVTGFTSNTVQSLTRQSFTFYAYLCHSAKVSILASATTTMSSKTRPHLSRTAGALAVSRKQQAVYGRCYASRSFSLNLPRIPALSSRHPPTFFPCVSSAQFLLGGVRRLTCLRCPLFSQKGSV